MQRKSVYLSIVVPCYNEEEIIDFTIGELTRLLDTFVKNGLISQESELVLVDDGSKDATWSIISGIALKNKYVRGIKLSRNYGHQNALCAGLLSANGDAIVSLDADLQDDINAIERMLHLYNDGYDVIYGARKRRTKDPVIKKNLAEGYYRMLKMLGVEIVFNHADFRLLRRKVVDELRGFRERNIFLRGLLPQLGFKSTVIEYDRLPRMAGETKYPYSKLFSLAWQGITSFSIAPLRIITTIGVVVFLISFLISGWALFAYFFSGTAVPGWTSVVVPMYLLGGIQLLCLGIIGEYLAKIFKEVKQRPLYIIEAQVGRNSEEDITKPANKPAPRIGKKSLNPTPGPRQI